MHRGFILEIVGLGLLCRIGRERARRNLDYFIVHLCIASRAKRLCSFLIIYMNKIGNANTCPMMSTPVPPLMNTYFQ